MLTYHYHCTACIQEFLVTRSIKEPPPEACPLCGSKSLQQIFYAVPLVDMTPKTIGGQADRNVAKAGHYERETRYLEIDRARQRARMDPRMLPPGSESIRKETPEAPWWRPGTKQLDPALVRADSAAKRQYLEKGKI